MRPLDENEYQTIKQVLDFIKKLLSCAESINPDEINQNYIAAIRKEINDLFNMLEKGQIKIKSSDAADIEAETDKNGIHINDKQDMFSIRGDLKLNDCSENDIKSLWLITTMLLHEKFHFERHTGLARLIFKSPLELFIGSGLLIFSTVVNKKTFRTLLWKEYQAYAYAYLLMQKIGYLLGDVCRINPNCCQCCKEHLKWHRYSMERQNPWSKYGFKHNT